MRDGATPGGLSWRAMPPKPIGAAPMSVAERSRRHRAKAKALRDANLAPLTPNSDRVETGVPDPNAAAPEPDGSGADYPRMLYHPDGRTIIADTPEHHARLMPDGWVIAPLAVHQQRPVSHHGFLGADHPFVLPMRRW
jgi:hypothetical protein